MTTPLWIEHAACNQPDTRGLPWKDPDDATPQQLTRMLDLCDTCPVLAECSADLERHGDYSGVIRAGVVWLANGRYKGQARKVVRCAGCGLVMLADGRGQRFCSARCKRRRFREAVAS